jgi:hypothetical protein
MFNAASKDPVEMRLIAGLDETGFSYRLASQVASSGHLKGGY